MLHVLAFAQRGRDVDVDVEAQARLAQSVMSEGELECRCPQGEVQQRKPAAKHARTHLSSPAVTGAIPCSVFIAPVFSEITARQFHGIPPIRGQHIRYFQPVVRQGADEQCHVPQRWQSGCRKHRRAQAYPRIDIFSGSRAPRRGGFRSG